MQYSTSVPIYLQVVGIIKEKIVKQELAPGEKLPSGREMAIQYTINPNTAARVYQVLEQEKLCFTKRGLGTFVTEDPARIQSLREEMAGALLEQFLDGMRKLGISREEAIHMIQTKEG